MMAELSHALPKLPAEIFMTKIKSKPIQLKPKQLFGKIHVKVMRVLFYFMYLIGPQLLSFKMLVCFEPQEHCSFGFLPLFVGAFLYVRLPLSTPARH